MSLIQGNASKVNTTAFYPKTIDQSLRFEDGDSAYLTFDPAADGDKDNWSLSFWFKRANLGLTQLLFGQGTSGSNNRDIVYIAADDTLEVASYGGSYVFRYITTQKFRDPSAWYHLVISYQSGDATASDRLRIYLNGERITAFSTSTNPSLNADSAHFNSGSPQYIGKYIDQSGSYLDGYMAEVHFIDGTAYTADAFGELKSGIWVAKAPSVTYGTNGFHLDFANSADIGNDISGNGNDWTPNNFTASDVVLDSPTDNFCTLNPLSEKNSPVLSEGNLKTTGQGTGSYRINTGTMGVTSGKWYFETVFTGSLSSENASVGITTQSFAGDISNSYLGNDSTEWAVMLDSPNDILKSHSGLSSYSDTWADGDVFQVAFDVDSQDIWFGKNGNWYASGNPSAGTNAAYTDLTSGATFYPAVSMLNSDAMTLNFGQQPFTYTPPTGFNALSTANLPDPVIDPAQGASPEDYFGTLIWAGTGGNRTIADGESGVTGSVNFTPDFIWTKSRTSASSHMAYDTVRGFGDSSELSPNQAIAEGGDNGDLYGYVSGNTSGGFTTVAGSTNADLTNTSGRNYVAWNWKANGSGVSNTDGSITSTVSANTTSGFSVVSYTGTGVNATVGHGLDSALDMLIVKQRTSGSATGWVVWHENILGSEFLILNETAAKDTASTIWNSTTPTASVFNIGTADAVNINTRDYIAYCFHSVEGFSKFGSYVGNGSTDGPFVYTGFRPSFLLVKRTDASDNWFIIDTARSEINVMGELIITNDSSAEFTSNHFDFTSNGFKLRNVGAGLNASGGTYVYMAFAEQPMKFSNAR